MIKKLFIGFLFAIFASISYGGNTYIDTSGLSESQIAELKATAAKTVAETSKGVNPSITPEKLSTWGTGLAQAAEGFARAINVAAKELGVTVNEFIHTDAGRIAVFIILWKVFGASLIKIIVGSFVFFIGCVLARILYNSAFEYNNVQTEYKNLFGMFTGTTVKRIRSGNGIDANHVGGILCIIGVTLITSLIIIF